MDDAERVRHIKTDLKVEVIEQQMQLRYLVLWLSGMGALFTLATGLLILHRDVLTQLSVVVKCLLAFGQVLLTANIFCLIAAMFCSESVLAGCRRISTFPSWTDAKILEAFGKLKAFDRSGTRLVFISGVASTLYIILAVLFSVIMLFTS
jgi:hypothetical protein